MEEGDVTKGVLYFRCSYTDGSEKPGWFRGAAVMKDNIGEVKRFLREDKQFAKPALRCYKLKILQDLGWTPDPEVERLAAEHEVEIAAEKEKKKRQQRKKKEKRYGVFSLQIASLWKVLPVSFCGCCFVSSRAHRKLSWVGQKKEAQTVGRGRPR